MQIIINADDFGFSPAVNEAVIRIASLARTACRRDITFAASVMVNMPFAEDAVKAAAEMCPDLPLGLHFNLTSGFALCSPHTALTDAAGNFRLGFFGLYRHCRTIDAAVKNELSAQLSAMDGYAAAYGMRFDHIDSHQHVHCIPGIFDLLRQESERRGVALRIPREPRRGMKMVTRPVGAMKREILNYLLCREIAARCTLTLSDVHPAGMSKGYFGIYDTGKMDMQAIHSAIRQAKTLKFDTVEVNVHPSTLSGQDELRCSPDDKTFHASVWRKKEYETLYELFTK